MYVFIALVRIHRSMNVTNMSISIIKIFDFDILIINLLCVAYSMSAP